jgi:hypothetical protein
MLEAAACRFGALGRALLACLAVGWGLGATAGVAWAAEGSTGADDVDGLVIAPPMSRDGVYELSWTATGDVLLEESRESSFEDARVVYRGADHGTVLTGRRDGVYYYRLRADGGSPGTVLTGFAQVEHHSVERAFVFFAIGLFVFVSTIVLVARGPEEGTPSAGGREEVVDG